MTNNNNVLFNSTITNKDIEKAQKFADLLNTLGKFDPEEIALTIGLIDALKITASTSSLVEEKPTTKEQALDYLEQHNRHAKHIDIITRLYFNEGKEYVQDFSRFANSNYMSEELLSALKNGKTLPDYLEREFEQFIIEKTIEGLS